MSDEAPLPPCWRMHALPPFYTLQPVAGSWQKQLELWSDALLSYAAAVMGAAPASSMVLLAPDSLVFSNPVLRRRLPPDAIAAVFEHLVRTHRSTVLAVPVAGRPIDGVATSEVNESIGSVLVAGSAGGMHALQRSVLEWVLEQGAGTTAAELAAKGAVFTFEELVEGGALAVGSSDVSATAVSESAVTLQQLPLHLQASLPALPPADLVLRALLASSGQGRSDGPLAAFKVTFFNLDGSDALPHQGVKIGGV